MTSPPPLTVEQRNAIDFAIHRARHYEPFGMAQCQRPDCVAARNFPERRDRLERDPDDRYYTEEHNTR